MPRPSVDSYPLYDYWPFTHMQAWNTSKYRSLLLEFIKMDGKPYNSSTKTEFMHNLKESKFYEPSKELTEEELSEKWGKYVSLIYYLGIGRTDRKKFELSEVTKHYFIGQDNIIGFLREQMLKFQYPHGSLRPPEISLLNSHNKKILPFVFILQILKELSERGLKEAYISKGELLTIVEKANNNNEVDRVISSILENRKQHKKYDLNTLPSRVVDINRLFSFFAGTGLIEFDNEDDLKTIYIKDSMQLENISLTLKNQFKFLEFSDRDQWIEYYQSLSSSYNKLGSFTETPKNLSQLTENEIDFERLLDSTSFDEEDRIKLHPLKPPNKINISRIMTNISEKKWLLPYFQRYFDWDKKAVKEFLESVFNDYYVGALLLWDIGNKEPEFDTMPIKGVDNNTESRIESIILDGQQRITSLYYAIKAPQFLLKGESKSLYFYINFSKFFTGKNPEEIIEFYPEKLDQETSFSRFLFPFYELERHNTWSDNFEEYLISRYKDKQDKIRKIRRIIEKRLTHIKEGFEIPYISLPETMQLTQVTDIFERINTMGKPLSVFDLLIARLSKSDIKLKDLWEKTESEYPKIKDYYGRWKIEKIPIYIIQAMLLSYNQNSECKRESQLNIYENIFRPNPDLKFEDIWDETSTHVEKGILRLESLRSSGYGVYNSKILPFEPVIPILAVLIKEIETTQKEKAECYKKLDIWYWSVVFSEAYSQAVDTQLTSDYKEMLVWFRDTSKVPQTVEKARAEFNILNLTKIRQQSNAKYKGVLNILALEGSKDFDTGQSFEYSKNDNHHLFPKATFRSKNDINSILNISLMSSDTNRKVIKCKKPSVYIKEFIKEKYNNNDERFLDILKTHFINREAYDYLLADKFEEFIVERDKILMQKIGSLIGAQVDPDKRETLISPETPFSNKLAIKKVISRCKYNLYWVDKYFSNKGLEYLVDVLKNNEVEDLKILIDGIPLLDKKTNTLRIDLRANFKDFREEMKNRGINCQLRVIMDNKVRSEIHDRWIITKNAVFNVPSIDIIERGQYSEIKETQSKLPFENWWEKSSDIIEEWDQIKKFYEK